MKRILSLALVLVMILSVMPMASAAWDKADCEPGGHRVQPENQVVTPATCGDEGLKIIQSCRNENCGAVNYEVIPATGEHTPGPAATCGDPQTCTVCGDQLAPATGEHVPAENVKVCAGPWTCDVCGDTVQASEHTYGAWSYLPATNYNCADGFVKTRECTVCGYDDEVTVAAGTEHVDSEGICTVCGKSTQISTLTVSATLALKVKGESTLTPSLSPAVSGATFSYETSDATVATVSNGKVTGVKEGSATITVTAKNSDGSVIDSAQCVVTVYNDGSIYCANDSTTASSYNLYPSLYLNGQKITNATFTFTGATAAADGKSATVTTATTGVVKKVTIAVASAKDSSGNSLDFSKVPAKDVYVSFYDIVNAEATVKKGVATFMFDDVSVFSDVEIDGVKSSFPGSYSVSSLWSGRSYYNVALEQVNAANDVARVSYTNSGSGSLVFNPVTTNVYNAVQVEYLKFESLKKGEFQLVYELLGLADMPVRTGVITINVNDGAESIEYTTTYNKSIQMDETDFVKFWKDAGMTANDLSYVTFNEQPVLGILYDDDDEAAKVTVYDKFYFSGTTDRLKYVTYDPYDTKVSYEDEISFTLFNANGTASVTGTVEIKVGEKMNFTDVKATDYFYDAVVWAVGEGITSGTSATTFSPNATCTRGQVVTFLYRAAGEPTVTGVLPFTDVKYTDYYYDAVLWAYKNNITTGLTATSFGPNSTVTRGQVVTFLARALKGSTSSAYNPFTDVKATDYFYDAVLWAVKNDVTTGLTATSFGPNSGCTRGQIVTFLYRAYEGE